MNNPPKESRSAGGVVLNKAGEVLVVDQHGQAWSLPKGRLEEGETDLEAAEREIQEESGIAQLNYVKDLGEYQRYRMDEKGGDDLSEIKTMAMFLFTTDQEELAPQDSENQEARWVPKEQVVELLTHRKDKEFFLSILEKLS